MTNGLNDHLTQNVLYAFAPGKITVVEPKTATVIKEISGGLKGSVWNDAVVTADNRLIFANDSSNNRVHVIDTEKQEIIKQIEVGDRPVHMFNPHHGNEMWTHSDTEGAFYVINIETLKTTAKVVAALDNTGHGKLRYHDTLGKKAYATNTNDPAVFVIDMEKKEVTKTIEVGDGKPGTHGKAYSPHSKHAYFECTGFGKTAVVDTTTDTVVKYLDVRGQLFESPDEKLIIVMDQRYDEVHVIDATKGSDVIGTISVAGGADQIYFQEQEGRLYGFTASTLSPDCSVIDFQKMQVIKRVAAGDIKRHEGAPFSHRGGVLGGGFFFTPAEGDGVVAIIDTNSRTLHAAVRVEGTTKVAYVGTRQ